MILDTTRLKLRLLNHSDAEMILALLNEESFIKNIGDKAVRNLQDALNYISNGPLTMQQDLGFSLYCCVKKDDEQAIGVSGLIKRDGIDHPEIGFAFLTQYCRQGYGYESALGVINYANNRLALKHLQAICNPDNEASKTLLQRLGFSFNKNIILAENNKTVMLFDLNSS
ncbi:GNAT family N-acetyltransferase [Colwellia sp. BRX10-3]|uniref:GNAT family N-acetyltransferase n=1 Tax=Colwellia sp. BRX10-3 TaxID=2759844 RepID=UPI0015F39B72|nr:GNAT family N-acetyltransferase [Colwellia sp. BRX10-3]MBA6391680.1 GNAT family N-acetyltransferase [Colwellia sp. BRX10-3]